MASHIKVSYRPSHPESLNRSTGGGKKTENVTVKFKINSLVGRIALAAGLLLLGLIFVRGIFSHYLVRTIADRRIVMGRAAVAAASISVPNSPRILLRLAEAELAEPAFDSQTFAHVRTHLALAINCSPWDYRLWQLLAIAQESDDNQEEARKSLAAAAKLAPNNVEVRWALANLMLRQGKLDESLDSFSAAIKGNSELLPIAFDLLWQSSNGNLQLLKTITANDVKSQLGLIQFLAEQSQMEAAIKLYQSIDAREKLKSSSASSFISSLVNEGQFLVARELWLNTVQASARELASGPIWNGGFELDLQKDFSHFDWTIASSDYARIGFDSGVKYSGGKSLKIIFAGRDTTKLGGEVKQLVALRPHTRYRLECYVKTANLTTPEGPRLALLSQNQIVTISEPVPGGSSEWLRLDGEFVSPARTSAIYVTIARLPRFSYDEPTRGTVWFDDFKLTEL